MPDGSPVYELRVRVDDGEGAHLVLVGTNRNDVNVTTDLIDTTIPFYLTGNGISMENCLILWPLRWLVAYLLINTFVRDTGMKLAAKVFKFDPGY